MYMIFIQFIHFYVTKCDFIPVYIYILPQAHRPCSDILHTWGFPTTVDPQVTKGFNTKRANLDHLGAFPILGNLHII